ncbi:MAG: hypothetical protein KC502_09830 [Myxococcales bacterium]|nr:hypothetical protein [Myxococcales bacterium]
MSLMLVLPSMASAKCGDGTSVWTAPKSGATALPRNLVVWVGVGGAASEPIAAALRGARFVAPGHRVAATVKPGLGQKVSSGVQLWVLSPKGRLRSNTRYTLKLDTPRVQKAAKAIATAHYRKDFMRAVQQLEELEFTTGKRDLRPSTRVAPRIKQATFTSRAMGCGPSRHLTLSLPGKDPAHMRYLVTLTHTKTGKRHQTMSPGLSIGHGMCRGLFRGWEPGMNRVTLQRIDLAGRAGPASKPVLVDIAISSRNAKR